MNLIEIGTAAQFAALRGFLAGADYREPRICEKLGLASAEALDIVSLSENLKERVVSPEPLNTLIKLFLLGEFVSIAEAETQFPGSAWAAMNALGLIEEDSADSRRCFGSVALYPVGDLFIVSDRWSNPDRKPKQSFPDIVYPALTKSTREFLRFLPNDSCGNFLELCGGSGIAALPPYMPVLCPAEIYYDGGEDGEQLTRRILEGLPQHLNPGGRLYCRTLGTDREEAPFEQRLRGWLGSAEGEFDVAVFISKNLDPARFATDSAVRRSTGQAEVNQWRALFERLHVKEILTGTVVVQRREKRRPVFTIRRSLAPNADSVATEKVLRWETQLVTETVSETVFGARPAASPRAQLIVRHRIEAGEFTPQDFTLTADYPFLMDCQVQPWMGYLLARCDGSRSVQQLYMECKEAEWIHPDTPPREFMNLIGMFVSGGFLNVEEVKLPAAKG